MPPAAVHYLHACLTQYRHRHCIQVVLSSQLSVAHQQCCASPPHFTHLVDVVFGVVADSLLIHKHVHATNATDNFAFVGPKNYCQPRCDEPWTEVLFESPQEGKIVVIVSPLVKLTRVKGAAIDEIGSPEGILNSLGGYITGTSLDVEGGEEVVSASSARQEDGRM